MLSFRTLARYQLITDLVIAGAFGLLAIVVELVGSAQTTSFVGATLMVIAYTAALAVRRLHPGLALCLAWVGAALQMGFGMTPSPTNLAIFAVLYATAAYGSTRVFWSGFGSAVAGAVIVPVYLVGRGMSEPPTAEVWFVAGALLLAAGFALMLSWVTGALVRTAMRAAANSRAQRAAEAETIAEQQRVRIARDMHDVVAHSLAVVIAQADGARYAAATDPAATSDALATISTTARSALTDVRLLLTQLRHSQAEGPQPTLAGCAARVDPARRVPHHAGGADERAATRCRPARSGAPRVVPRSRRARGAQCPVHGILRLDVTGRRPRCHRHARARATRRRQSHRGAGVRRVRRQGEPADRGTRVKPSRVDRPPHRRRGRPRAQ